MARIDINKPYEEFLKSQVEAGLFRSITAAAEDAIRRQMEDYENRRINSVLAEIAKGEADVLDGKTQVYSAELMSDIVKSSREEVRKKSQASV
ncbi:hypothetical protein SAMN06298216_3393 [Spirosomataceae bacterium TFI 002]|nr:hypothetical protein SAMN06298216_3393 [Spirosomataceae bacterium TFI 002]